MKKKPVNHVNHHPVEKIFKILGAVVITGILVYQLLFYSFFEIPYAPTFIHIITTLIVLGVLLYSYFLVLTIKSWGKIVVVFMLFLTTIFLSVVLLYIFTPLLDFFAARVVNEIFCLRVPWIFKDFPQKTIESVQGMCKQMSIQFFFNR